LLAILPFVACSCGFDFWRGQGSSPPPDTRRFSHDINDNRHLWKTLVNTSYQHG